MLPLLKLRIVCAARRHCRACRSSGKTRKAIGFPKKCPEGWTIDKLPEAPPADPPAKFPEFAVDRLAVCEKCDRDCPVLKYKSCRRRAVLARENFHCPSGEF